MRVEQELIAPKEQLNEIVQTFWNLESVGVSKNEFDICENFEADSQITVMKPNCRSNQNMAYQIIIFYYAKVD